MSIAQALKEFLYTYAGADFTEHRYVLAVSGGLDSMLLLEEFAALINAPQLVVAHYQHGLRAVASEEDANLVHSAASRLQLEYVLGRREEGGVDEASLRALRHAFLEKVRQECAAQWIVTAHHLDDQFETVLMRLVRGTGLDGLQGIPLVRGPWLRPLLALTRATLAARARELQIQWREDESNQSGPYLRNRVRHTLTPVFATLAGDFGGQESFLQRVGGLIEEVRQSESALEAQTRSLYIHMAVWTPFWMRFEKTLLDRLTSFWKARVFRLGLKQMGVPTLDRAAIDRLVQLSTSQMPAASMAGVRIVQSCGYLYLQTPEQSQYAGQPRRVILDGRRVHVPDLETTFTLPAQWVPYPIF